MVKKIALEEHFLCPGFIEYWNPTVAEMPAAKRENLLNRNTDFGEMRLASMDKAGISRAVLALAGPGVQAERDVATAIRTAKSGNDFLAKEIQKRPDRYSGFAHLPMQDAKAAADELERCVKELKFCGAMINGHTLGQYLDHPSLSPFWERAEALGTLIYIHPTDPVSVAPVLQGHPGLRRATWEWTFETGSHALRLIFGGVFDRFPKARLGLGHMGETLAVPAVALRQPHRTGFLQCGFEKSGVALHQEQHRDHHVGHVLGGTAELRDRGARARTASCSARTIRSRRRKRPGTGSTPRNWTRPCGPISRIRTPRGFWD